MVHHTPYASCGCVSYGAGHVARRAQQEREGGFSVDRGAQGEGAGHGRRRQPKDLSRGANDCPPTAGCWPTSWQTYTSEPLCTTTLCTGIHSVHRDRHVGLSPWHGSPPHPPQTAAARTTHHLLINPWSHTLPQVLCDLGVPVEDADGTDVLFQSLDIDGTSTLGLSLYTRGSEHTIKRAGRKLSPGTASSDLFQGVFMACHAHSRSCVPSGSGSVDLEELKAAIAIILDPDADSSFESLMMAEGSVLGEPIRRLRGRLGQQVRLLSVWSCVAPVLCTHSSVCECAIVVHVVADPCTTQDVAPNHGSRGARHDTCRTHGSPYASVPRPTE